MSNNNGPISNLINNGHTNGNRNGSFINSSDEDLSNGRSCWERGIWAIGLINSKFKYLTAETFGFKVNANGTSLRKKQIWFLESGGGTEGAKETVYLRSHLGRYLAVDQFGNITCDSEKKEAGAVFEIQTEKKSGRWELRNISRGYFLGAGPDKLTCTAKAPTADGELWSVHLSARPQLTLKSIGRKRYAHLGENGEDVIVDCNLPWGADTLFTLEFRDGYYALHTPNNKYLAKDGKLLEKCVKDTLFSLEYHHGQLALRDSEGLYIAPVGSKAILRTRSHIVTKDELFLLEDSLPQGAFVAGLNSRFASVKQGVDVSANQEEISDDEVFQLEFESNTRRWYFRTMKDKYWILETQGGIQASAATKSSNGLFELEWKKDGAVAIRANNGKYIGAKRSGHLYANAEVNDENATFYFYLINRPNLVLKCDQGYVGYKSSTSPKLECNKANYETIQVQRTEKGMVHFQGLNGKYWTVVGDEVNGDGEVPTKLSIELREPSRIAIKTEGGLYLNALKNGKFGTDESGEGKVTNWEF